MRRSWDRLFIYFVSILTLNLLQSCSLFTQYDFVESKIILNTEKETIFHEVYKTGIDNYRFEFKTTNNGDTIKLFDYFLNDAVYIALKLQISKKNDTLMIIVNMPTETITRKTKRGTIILFTN